VDSVRSGATSLTHRRRRFVEVDGVDHFYYHGDSERFFPLCRIRHRRARGAEDDRAGDGAFTDIVGSTEKVASLGDQAWRDLLERHHALVRRQITHFRGREIATAGDGFLALFDGPARGVRCGLAVRDAAGARARAACRGAHGECVRMGTTSAWIAVHIGARIAAEAERRGARVEHREVISWSGLAELEDRGSRGAQGRRRRVAAVRGRIGTPPGALSESAPRALPRNGLLRRYRGMTA
jgi:class 3 adenylate cyclase